MGVGEDVHEEVEDPAYHSIGKGDQHLRVTRGK